MLVQRCCCKRHGLQCRSTLQANARVQACNRGKGVCNAAATTCACQPGYTGPDCEQCDDGFSMYRPGLCEPDLSQCNFPPQSCDIEPCAAPPQSSTPPMLPPSPPPPSPPPSPPLPPMKNRKAFAPWSQCSAGCGGGTQNRTATCLDEEKATVNLSVPHSRAMASVAALRC